MDVIEPHSTLGNQNLFSGETLKDGINIYLSVIYLPILALCAVLEKNYQAKSHGYWQLELCQNTLKWKGFRVTGGHQQGLLHASRRPPEFSFLSDTLNKSMVDFLHHQGKSYL